MNNIKDGYYPNVSVKVQDGKVYVCFGPITGGISKYIEIPQEDLIPDKVILKDAEEHVDVSPKLSSEEKRIKGLDKWLKDYTKMHNSFFNDSKASSDRKYFFMLGAKQALNFLSIADADPSKIDFFYSDSFVGREYYMIVEGQKIIICVNQGNAEEAFVKIREIFDSQGLAIPDKIILNPDGWM